jgi:GT2 family glycosyltransferase
MVEIAVIIVNYGTAKLALEAVESVLRRVHGGRSVEIHLVDNASPGGDAETIMTGLRNRGLEDRVCFYSEQQNHGFGRGNNIVLSTLATRDSPPEYVFLLNPDAILENESIAILAAFLDTHPKAAMAGAAIRKPGKDSLVTASFRFPGLASTFAGAANLGPVTKLLKRHTVPLSPNSGTVKVDWVAGAAVMVRFDVWRDLGFFDPYYFLYFEELDLMLQTARAGWECWYVPDARVVHVEGASTGVKSSREKDHYPRRPAYWYASWRHYFTKNHGRAYALACALCWVSGSTLNHMMSPLLGRAASVPRHFYGDVWAMVLRPLLGMAERPY